jgi:hypothetical protein
MTYNKFDVTKNDTVTTWLLRLLWPFIWGPAALAVGVVTKTGWATLAGLTVLIVWIYIRTLPLRNRHTDKQRYRGSGVDLKWLRKTLAKASALFEAAGLAIPNLRDPDGPPITPKVLSHGPCPQGCRLVIEPIPGVQHGGDFLDRLRNLETAFGRKLIVELSDDPCKVILIFRFTDPLAETRRPTDDPFGQ